MARYDGVFNSLGLREWCDAEKTDGPMSMAQLLAKAKGNDGPVESAGLPFPSLDELHEACAQIGQTRDLTEGIEQGFLAMFLGSVNAFSGPKSVARDPWAPKPCAPKPWAPNQ